MEKTQQQQNERQASILALMHREIVPAIGCTEPVAVALCATKARELLGNVPEKLTVRLSGNMLKNAMGVGIPGTGMTGLPIAVALGLLVGRSEWQLEVLRDTTPEAVEQARRLLDTMQLHIEVADTQETLYVECLAQASAHTGLAVICGSHTRFVRLEADGKLLLKDDSAASDNADGSAGEPVLTLREVYNFAMTVPLEDIAFLREAAEMDLKAAEYSFTHSCGHKLGSMLRTEESALFGKTPFTRIIAYTAGACDARMGGAMVPVMSNSGSGNQGISATVPVVIYGRESKAADDDILRALALSNLTVIYIKQSLGRLSALCGCVVAATGSACGITRLMGGGYEEVTYAVKNMTANITGMICDGAKPGCALKVASGVSTALLSATMAMHHRHTDAGEGIVCSDVDRCIQNMTTIGREGMQQTDKLILDIMTR